MRVSKRFFDVSTKQLARRLLGKYLFHTTTEGTTIGRIVETEAYLFKGDPACHASKGKTKRNAPMFGPAGTVYIYLIYGMHYCFNVVSGKVDQGEAVLIRALEPIYGIQLMEQRRNLNSLRMLCNGPAKLVQAMGISISQNQNCLRNGQLRIVEELSAKHRPLIPPSKLGPIFQTTRIGISSGKELPLRYYCKNSKFISVRG